MSSKEDKKILKDLKAAMRIFPKIVRQKERAFREKEKILKRFAPVSRQLQKLTLAREERDIRVREHPRSVPVSEKNPDGVTMVDQHRRRRIPGKSLGRQEIKEISQSYPHAKIAYPTSKRLSYKRADEFDDLIAVWVDYFNNEFKSHSPLDPDVLKALIGSESSFNPDPKNNPVAIGLTQITKSTLKLIQDPKGEAKEFIFKGLRQKDLKDPDVAIAVAARWLFRKKETARHKLKREPTNEEIILEYKGLLKSKSKYKENALAKFKKDYELLKK